MKGMTAIQMCTVFWLTCSISNCPSKDSNIFQKALQLCCYVITSHQEALKSILTSCSLLLFGH